ncbi:SOS response-associated peptidase [Lactobacillus kalixensis]|uniref:Abasic site processing protein n=1 Tax=Lactobacillus kalixensis DSM 16043 TaxID=1423763 RepID=A0A0R1UGM4_9LACO|nr:SOS response-associated peptidase family protein [Lactobacillus kalixensis]KRL90474.1 hypothetical protein FC46_GL001919 [Lactobacillus kalixensis DSM 16043]
MCNQFSLPSLRQIQQYLTQDLDLPLKKPDFSSDEQDIFPNEPAPILLYQDDELKLVQKKWGYPSPVDGKPLFNARIERFYEEKPSMWDQSFARQRCLIVAQNFFEYSKKTYQVNNKKYHEKFSFADPDHPLTLIAGIYDGDHFAMVTTEPNASMSPVHNRMPLVLKPDELRRWLFQNFTSLIDRSDFDLTVRKMPKKK